MTILAGNGQVPMRRILRTGARVQSKKHQNHAGQAHIHPLPAPRRSKRAYDEHRAPLLERHVLTLDGSSALIHSTVVFQRRSRHITRFCPMDGNYSMPDCYTHSSVPGYGGDPWLIARDILCTDRPSSCSDSCGMLNRRRSNSRGSGGTMCD